MATINEQAYDNYLTILQDELIMALGCTEPIAIAYASAKARDELGAFPDRIEVNCSGNIIKNVKGVTVPNSGGLKGIDVAAVLGVVGGCADEALQVLTSIEPSHIEKAQELIAKGFCNCSLAEGVENLYVQTVAFSGEQFASVTIQYQHTFIAEIIKDGEVIYSGDMAGNNPNGKRRGDKSKMSIQGILDFAQAAKLEDIKPILERQIEYNGALADEGLRGRYGAEVGRTMLDCFNNEVGTIARFRAAAASDARMGGCALPAVINSGSGNQGITVSVPVVEYAKAWKLDEDKLYRALVISNLLSIHQKKYVGNLSAYCGAVSAACGAGAGITYLAGGDFDAISRTVINTVANVGGIVCDGAKSSCASKIAAALEAAILAHHMSLNNRVFQPGEGIVGEDAESTIRSIGYVGNVGMRQTDIEILNIMLEKTDVHAI